MLRVIGAIVVPWLVWGALAQVFRIGLASVSPGSFDESGAPTTTSMMVAVLVLTFLYSFIAGWVAAKIAAGRVMAVRAAVVLLLLTGIVFQAAAWSLIPLWYHVIFLISIVPMALLGARLAGSAPAVGDPTRA